MNNRLSSEDGPSHSGSRALGLTIAQPLIDLSHELFGGEVPECRIVHDPVEYLLVAFHAVDEEPFEHAVEHMLEIVERVGPGGGFQGLVLGGSLCDLVEEELV